MKRKNIFYAIFILKTKRDNCANFISRSSVKWKHSHEGSSSCVKIFAPLILTATGKLKSRKPLWSLHSTDFLAFHQSVQSLKWIFRNFSMKGWWKYRRKLSIDFVLKLSYLKLLHDKRFFSIEQNTILKTKNIKESFEKLWINSIEINLHLIKLSYSRERKTEEVKIR